MSASSLSPGRRAWLRFRRNRRGFVSLWVQRKSTSPASGAVGDIIEIALGSGFLEYANDAAGIAIPEQM